jgi:thiamine-phosphate pyrophosphorylase
MQGMRDDFAGGAAPQWRVCLLLTEASCRRPWREALAAAIAGGIDCVQVREKSMDGRALAARVREVIDVARPRGVAVVVNDRADVALACGADGVHVGQGDLAPADVRRVAGDALLVGVSTHCVAEAECAVAAGADLCGVGAMFASRTKPDVAPQGEAYLCAYLARFAHVPHLAIGGIEPANVAQLAAAGCRGVAVSSVVCGAEDPGAVAHALRTGLGAAS